MYSLKLIASDFHTSCTVFSDLHRSLKSLFIVNYTRVGTNDTLAQSNGTEKKRAFRLGTDAFGIITPSEALLQHHPLAIIHLCLSSATASHTDFR